MSPVINGFLSGLITMCFGAVGLCFARFWYLNRDPLFVAFAVAFWLLAANQALAGLAVVPHEEQSWVYLLRIAAFLVIATAIVRKNICPEDDRGCKSPEGKRGGEPH
jgi:hypothetical protein